jgi:hypothetical protein
MTLSADPISTSPMQLPLAARHGVVAQLPGRTLGWPVNAGRMWRWGSELLMAFTNVQYAHHGYWEHVADKHDHPYSTLARSRDDGLTWSIEQPANFGYKDRSSPLDARPTSELDPIDFTHPDFCIAVYEPDGKQGFQFSYDRGRTWSPVYALPLLNGYTGLAPRTDIVVNSARDALLLVTGNNASCNGYVSCYHTTDGGRSWTFRSQVGPQLPGDWCGQSDTLRLSPSELLCSFRLLVSDKSVKPAKRTGTSPLYHSRDNGLTWQFRSAPMVYDKLVNTSPGQILRLRDGRLLFVTANRRSHVQGYAPDRYQVSQMQARVSADDGRTWGPTYIVRDNAGSWDIGYPRAVVRADGQVVVAYYWCDRVHTTGPSHGEEANHAAPRYIAYTVFDPAALSHDPASRDGFAPLDPVLCDYTDAPYHFNAVGPLRAGQRLVFQRMHFASRVGRLHATLQSASRDELVVLAGERRIAVIETRESPVPQQITTPCDSIDGVVDITITASSDTTTRLQKLQFTS